VILILAAKSVCIIVGSVKKELSDVMEVLEEYWLLHDAGVGLSSVHTFQSPEVQTEDTSRFLKTVANWRPRIYLNFAEAAS
jgi:hypothetical protein